MYPDPGSDLGGVGADLGSEVGGAVGVDPGQTWEGRGGTRSDVGGAGQIQVRRGRGGADPGQTWEGWGGSRSDKEGGAGRIWDQKREGLGRNRIRRGRGWILHQRGVKAGCIQDQKG